MIPTAGIRSTEQDVAKNDVVILTLATHEAEGFDGYQGAGFRINEQASFLREGEYYDEMKALYPFLNRVLAVKVKEVKQLP